MPAQQYETLLNLIPTTDDVDRINEALDLFIASLYKTDRREVSEKMDELLPSHFSEALKQSLKESSIGLQDTEEIKRFVSGFKTHLLSLKTVSLTLAFDPPQKSIDDLSIWVKQNFGVNTVMEIAIHPQILGGAVIVAGGRYIDKSLKKKLDILFTVKRQEIAQMIK